MTNDEVMVACQFAAEAFVEVNESGHPMEIGIFGRSPASSSCSIQSELFSRTHAVSRGTDCYSAFDIAIHDAYGNLYRLISTIRTTVST